ncbi:hypothetical protein [uncultured Thermosynechococcus sp.]|uniref:hypothetical protein n=1 Tax=uncultured Thermosynechococcus sp. TaxID=436945 RepID=UPI002605C650|nr:hypothetical protein [uncultured Thermosynechococcus sp.]
MGHCDGQIGIQGLGQFIKGSQAIAEAENILSFLCLLHQRSQVFNTRGGSGAIRCSPRTAIIRASRS